MVKITPNPANHSLCTFIEFCKDWYYNIIDTRNENTTKFEILTNLNVKVLVFNALKDQFQKKIWIIITY